MTDPFESREEVKKCTDGGMKHIRDIVQNVSVAFRTTGNVINWRASYEMRPIRICKQYIDNNCCA